MASGLIRSHFSLSLFTLKSKTCSSLRAVSPEGRKPGQNYLLFLGDVEAFCKYGINPYLQPFNQSTNQPINDICVCATLGLTSCAGLPGGGSMTTVNGKCKHKADRILIAGMLALSGLLLMGGCSTANYDGLKHSIDHRRESRYAGPGLLGRPCPGQLFPSLLISSCNIMMQ